jgi:hypothetical protein
MFNVGIYLGTSQGKQVNERSGLALAARKYDILSFSHFVFIAGVALHQTMINYEQGYLRYTFTYITVARATVPQGIEITVTPPLFSKSARRETNRKTRGLRHKETNCSIYKTLSTMHFKD